MTQKHYPWKVETMRKYVERRGEEFRRDLFDKTMTQRQIQEKHGLDQSQVSLLRVSLVPPEQRRRHKHTVTDEMIAAFKTKATNKQLAKRYKIPYATMERLRRRHIGTRHTPEVRLTPQVMTLLRSSFSDGRVAFAMNVHACTIWELRVKLGIRTPKTKIVVTEEQRDILATSKSYVEAARRLGMSRATIRRWFFLVQEGLL
jgi:hypothetical protein